MASIAQTGAQTLREERTFFGHPRGLAYLAFTEMWERLRHSCSGLR
jgi:dipeptide/tripeptide permease